MRKFAVLLGLVVAVTVVLGADADTRRADAQTLTGQTQTLLVKQTFQGTLVILPLQRLFLENASGQRCRVSGQFPVETAITRLVLPLQIADGQTCDDVSPVRICATETPNLDAATAICSEKLALNGSESTVELAWPEAAQRRVITTHFVHNGAPQQVTLRGWSFLVDGQLCRSGGIYSGSGPEITVSDVSRFWSAYFQGDPCVIMGREVSARYDTVEFGTLSGSFTWQGLDSEVIIETGTIPPVPAPSPMTVPRFSAAITVRHMYRGVPVIVDIDHRLSTGDVNGTRCGYGHSTDVQAVTAIVSRQGWPFSDHFPCDAIGLPVHICVGFAVCSKEFTFNGNDTTVDMNWPDEAFQGVTFGRVHFRRDDAPQHVTLKSLTLASSGAECFSLSWPQRGDTPAATISDLAHYFPTVTCSTAGETVDATFETVEFGELHGSFVWSGGDVDYDIVIPSAETPSPAPPTPTVTPARLPSAGGPPANAEGALPLLAGGLAAIVLATGAWRMSARRSRT